MTIDEMISHLQLMKEKVGGEAEVAVVRINYGENDYIVPKFGVVGDFEDQDGYEYRAAFVGEIGGEEFTEKEIPHYKWKPKPIKCVKNK